MKVFQKQRFVSTNPLTINLYKKNQKKMSNVLKKHVFLHRFSNEKSGNPCPGGEIGRHATLRG